MKKQNTIQELTFEQARNVSGAQTTVTTCTSTEKTIGRCTARRCTKVEVKVCNTVTKP